MNNISKSLLSKCDQNNTLEAYEIGKTIGEGNFAKVRQAVHKQTNQSVAIKIFQKLHLVELKDIERVSREIQILKILKHPNIIQLYEVKALFCDLESH